MTCADVMEAASPFLDGELPPERGEMMAAHLSSCAKCASEMDRLRRLDEVLARVASTLARVPTKVSPAGRRRPGWALAACLLLAFVGTWLMQPPPSRCTVRLPQRSYEVAVDGGTLLSVEVYDSRGGSSRFDNGSVR